MANILMSYYSEMGEPLYDAVASVLLKNGNNVFRLNINNNYVNITRWGDICKTSSSSLLNRIKEFNPDLIINYNNSLPVGVHEILDKDCLNCIVDADNANYFWNKEHLMKHKQEYYYLGQQTASKKIYDDYLGMPLTDDNYLYFPGATIIQRKEEVKDKNISFIGTNFHLSMMPSASEYYSEDALKIYNLLREDYYYDVEKIAEMFPNICNISSTIEELRASIAGQERLKCLQALSDLGLTIYGVRWENIAYYDFELAKCFDNTSITTMPQNEWVYNTSKLSVNISHPQAITSFSWRVMDIMASGACLLTEHKDDWLDLFGKYMSDETKEAVVYSDCYDLREKAKRLLDDEDLRLKCVSEMNDAIEKNGRWESRFLSLERKLGVKIIGNKNNDLRYIRIKRGSVEDNKTDTETPDVEQNNEDSKKPEDVVNKTDNTPVKQGYISRLLHNGMYKISHVPKIRYYLWDIIRP